MPGSVLMGLLDFTVNVDAFTTAESAINTLTASFARLDASAASNLSGVNSALNAITTSSAQMSTSVEGSMRNATASVGGLEVGLRSLMSVLTPLIGTLSVGAVVDKIAQSFSNWGERVRLLTAEMGTSTEQASKWLGVSELMGQSGNEFQAGIVRMSRALDQYATATDAGRKGAATTTEALRLLNIEVEKSPGVIKSTNDIILEMADRFQTLPDGVNKSAAVMALFGRNAGPEVVAMLNLGRGAIEQYMNVVQQAGLVMDSAGVQKTFQYNLALRELGLAFQGFSVAIGNLVMPDLTAFFLNLVKDVESARTSLADVKQLVLDVKAALGGGVDLGWLEKLVAYGPKNIGEFRDSFVKSIIDVRAMIEVLRLGFKEMADNAAANFAYLKETWGDFVTFVRTTWADLGTTISGSSKTIADALRPLALVNPSIATIVQGLDALKAGYSQSASAVYGFSAGVASSNTVLGGHKTTLDEVKDALVNTYTGARQVIQSQYDLDAAHIAAANGAVTQTGALGGLTGALEGAAGAAGDLTGALIGLTQARMSDIATSAGESYFTDQINAEVTAMSEQEAADNQYATAMESYQNRVANAAETSGARQEKAMDRVQQKRDQTTLSALDSLQKQIEGMFQLDPAKDLKVNLDQYIVPQGKDAEIGYRLADIVANGFKSKWLDWAKSSDLLAPDAFDIDTKGKKHPKQFLDEKELKGAANYALEVFSRPDAPDEAARRLLDAVVHPFTTQWTAWAHDKGIIPDDIFQAHDPAKLQAWGAQYLKEFKHGMHIAVLEDPQAIANELIDEFAGQKEKEKFAQKVMELLPKDLPIGKGAVMAKLGDVLPGFESGALQAQVDAQAQELATSIPAALSRHIMPPIRHTIAHAYDGVPMVKPFLDAAANEYQHLGDSLGTPVEKAMAYTIANTIRKASSADEVKQAVKLANDLLKAVPTDKRNIIEATMDFNANLTPEENQKVTEALFAVGRAAMAAADSAAMPKVSLDKMVSTGAGELPKMTLAPADIPTPNKPTARVLADLQGYGSDMATTFGTKLDDTIAKMDVGTPMATMMGKTIIAQKGAITILGQTVGTWLGDGINTTLADVNYSKTIIDNLVQAVLKQLQKSTLYSVPAN